MKVLTLCRMSCSCTPLQRSIPTPPTRLVALEKSGSRLDFPHNAGERLTRSISREVRKGEWSHGERSNVRHGLLLRKGSLRRRLGRQTSQGEPGAAGIVDQEPPSTGVARNQATSYEHS